MSGYGQFIMLGLQAIGGGMSMFGGQKASKAQAQNLRYQAQIQQNNALTAEKNRREAALAGSSKEDIARTKLRNTLADQKVALAANGVDLASLSVNDLEAGTKAYGYADIMSIRNETRMNDKKLRQQAIDFTTQSDMLNLQAANVKAQGKANMLNQGIGTLSSMGSSAYNMGMFNGGSSSGMSGSSMYGSSFDQPSLGDNGIY